MKKRNLFITAFTASSLLFSNTALVMAEEAPASPAALTLESHISETGAEFLSGLADFDLSWLKTIAIDANISPADAIAAINFVLSVNETNILDGQFFADSETKSGYLSLPELAEQAMLFDLSELETVTNGSLSSSFSFAAGDTSAIFNNVEGLAEALEDEEYVNSLMENYALPFLGIISEVEPVQMEVEYDDNSATIDCEGIAVNVGDLIEQTINVLTTAKDDETLLKILEASTASSGQTFGPDEIDALIEELKNEQSDEEMMALNVVGTFGVSDEGDAYVGELALCNEEEELPVLDFIAFNTEEGLIGTIYGGLEEEVACVDFTISDTNDFILTLYGEAVLEVVASFDAEEGFIKLYPIAESEDSPLADFEGFSLQFDYNVSGEQILTRLSVLYDDEELADLGLTIKDGEAIEIPDLASFETVKIESEEDFEEYLMSGNVFAIISNLVKAGLPMEAIGE